tara:strand:+ start:174 stop:608 length:435 start_codon:yes stop_codon:yes gene_type:complete
MQSRERKEEEVKQVRTPIGGQRTQLQLSEADQAALDEAGFLPRWINDIGGRLEAAKAGGYEHVTKEEATSLGHGAVMEREDLGHVVSRIVDKRTGDRAYLMKIRKEFYEEDQRAKEERNMQVDRAMRSVDQGGQNIEGGYTPTT